MKPIHLKEVEFIESRDASKPGWSNIVELLLRNGIKACKKEKSTEFSKRKEKLNQDAKVVCLIENLLRVGFEAE